MELTKEHFDQGIAKILDVVVTKNVFEQTLEQKLIEVESRINSRMDSRIDGLEYRLRRDLASKEDLDTRTEGLKDYIHDGLEIQQL